MGGWIAALLWLVAGLWMANAYAIEGLLWCVTIIGISYGLQYFKMARLSLLPFGVQVV